MPDYSVKHLDTEKFAQTVTNYATYIKDYEEIIEGIDGIVDELLRHWQGEGRKAFESDSNIVRLNLKDIRDIMYDMREALVDAEAEYVESDLALSKSYES